MHRIRKYLKFGLKWQLRNHRDVALSKLGLVTKRNVRSTACVTAMAMTDLDRHALRRTIASNAIPGIVAVRDAMRDGIDQADDHDDAYDAWLHREDRL